MKTMECSDFALEQIAIVLVDQARRDPSCVTFADALARAESSPWPGLAMTPIQRRNFRELVSTAWNSNADLAPSDEAHEIVHGSSPVLERAS